MWASDIVLLSQTSSFWMSAEVAGSLLARLNFVHSDVMAKHTIHGDLYIGSETRIMLVELALGMLLSRSGVT